MSGLDLLKGWPGWEKADAATVFASPAWMMTVRWGDEPCRLRKAEAKVRDVIGLSILLDDEPHVLGLGNREAFPDLHALWNEKRRLPDALLLALVERECGPLLQLIENAARMQLSVKGLAEAVPYETTVGYEVVTGEGRILASFVLDSTPALIRSFGALRHLDVAREEIRALTRPMRVEYAAFELAEADREGLACADRLLLPEIATGAMRWTVETPSDGLCHIRAASTVEVTFGALADGALPQIPAPTELELVRNGARLAKGRAEMFGEQIAFVVEEVG